LKEKAAEHDEAGSSIAIGDFKEKFGRMFGDRKRKKIDRLWPTGPHRLGLICPLRAKNIGPKEFVRPPTQKLKYDIPQPGGRGDPTKGQAWIV